MRVNTHTVVFIAEPTRSRGRPPAATATTVPKRRRVSPTPQSVARHTLNNCRRTCVVLGAFRSSAGAVRRTPPRRCRCDLESVPTTPQLVARHIVNDRRRTGVVLGAFRSSAGAVQRTPPRRCRRYVALVLHDPATGSAACLDPSALLKHVYRNTWTTRRCRPADLGSRRSGRGDVVIVGTCFSHISSLPRASYKFISTRRPPGVARASTVAREVLIWRRCDKFIVFSVLQECVMII